MLATQTPLQPRTVLAIGAHPDDLDVTAGGTLAKFAKQGAVIHFLILTDGGKGSDDVSVTTAQLIETRRHEQQTAFAILGGESITFLDHPDGALEVTMDLKREIVQAIRRVKPDVVISMDPTVLYSVEANTINHPDHRAGGQAVLDAVFPLARDRLSFPELYDQFKPHKTPTILLANFEKGNFTVDIADTFETKMTMIRAHESQFDVANLTWVEELARTQGKDANIALGERFIRLDIK